MFSEIIIAEKEAQAEDLARALGFAENPQKISIPTKEYVGLVKKTQVPLRRYLDKDRKIKEMEAKTPLAKLTTLVSYQKLVKQRQDLSDKIAEIERKKALIEPTLNTIDVRMWELGDKVLVACTGHLLDITFKSPKELLAEAEAEPEEDEGEEESEGEAEVEYISKLRFEVKLKAPSPLDTDNLMKFARFTLISILIDDADETTKYICATDYDREGQSIFGSIMEFFDIPFEQCSRMKFSTLEASVLQSAYANQIDFDEDIYDSGKARRWLDYVIGFNLNPQFSKLYRETIADYLGQFSFSPELVKQLSYNSFNIGRVKLVILDYIHENTNEQVEKSSELVQQSVYQDPKELYSIWFEDHSRVYQNLINSDDELFEGTNFDYDLNIETRIDNIEEVTQNLEKEDLQIPTLLNFSDTFEICRDLGANTEKINRILEYLYLQKYISYPRSKSQKWEIPIDADAINYAESVLDALDRIGYPVKHYYRGKRGNEGSETHSHPCIHPLPSLTADKVESLRSSNPLAFLVFNEICIHTLMAFETLPVVKAQKLIIQLTQGSELIRFQSTLIYEVVENNIGDFLGMYLHLSQKVDAQAGDVFSEIPLKKVETTYLLEKNREDFTPLNDFDVIKYLNDHDIGTDATRAVILNELIELQYLVSPNVLLTTFLGFILSELSEKYVQFIDEQYTKKIEGDLNEIEKGNLDIGDFEQEVKILIKDTCEQILVNSDEIKELFIENLPECEVHETPMILRNGKFGKFLQCPHFYDAEQCKQNLSM